MKQCWCGNTNLASFNLDYKLCKSCVTLVSMFENTTLNEEVQDDDQDFYGKNYWLEASNEFPDIFVRSRYDLSERNLHWLKYLLNYRLPPAKILEIGCAHGSFLGLLQQLGYPVTGMEMSPWVLEYAKNVFQVDMVQGPLNKTSFAPNTAFDVIFMMDVLEHLSDPVQTMQTCLNYLSDDGLIFIQMPNFPADKPASDLINQPFEKMMIPNEHLFLYSEQSVQQFFGALSCPYLEFLPAIFNQYDMFLVVSRQPLNKISKHSIEEALSSSMNGRLIQALLDLRDSEQKYLNAFLEKKNELEKLQKFIPKKMMQQCKKLLNFLD